MWKRPAERSADSAYPIVEDGALSWHGDPYPARGWDSSPVNDPQSLRGRAMWDSPVWQVPFPVAEISEANAQDVGDFEHGAPESITRWSPWEHGGVTPLASDSDGHPPSHNLLGTANFFASDPSRGPGSNVAGCYMSTNWTHMVMNQPGTVMLGHQTFWAPFQPKPSLDFSPSTVYEPFPSFGTVARKIV